MSLFGSIQLGANALNAAQIGLNVTGNNIANASTEGYLRQEAILQTAPGQRLGNLVFGLGVEVAGVVQRVDKLLERRLHTATSDLEQSETQESAYSQLEAVIAELSEQDLSTSLTKFFSSLHDVANQPENVAVRHLAVLSGKALTHDIRTLEDRVRDIQIETNQRVVASAGEINNLVEEIADLNVKIVSIENGGTLNSDAVGLRDQQLVAINKLAELVEIRAIEQPNGSTAVYAGGDILVFDNLYNEVEVVEGSEGPLTSVIHIKRTAAPLAANAGKLAGLYQARDTILGGFIDGLDDLSRALIFEFNKAHSSGQGLSGFTEVTSEFALSDGDLALDSAELPFSPVNGSLEVQVFNSQTGLTETHDVFIQLNGLDTDTSANDLIASLDAIDGLSASLTPTGHLQIQTDSPHLELAFANDSSGVLAALGINTFFSGQSANDISVNTRLQADPGKLAVSTGGIAADAANIEILAGFQDRPLEDHNGSTLSLVYEQLIATTTQGAAVNRSVAEGLRVFQQTLEGQKLAKSGVSIDEEAVKMIEYQRVFQATARYIQTISDLLEVLINL